MDTPPPAYPGTTEPLLPQPPKVLYAPPSYNVLYNAGFVATGADGQLQQSAVMDQPQTIGGSQVVVVVVPAAEQTDQRLHGVNDLLCLSVFTTLCCNLVFGIIAIVFSLRVNNAKRDNDFEKARCSNRVVIAMNVSGIVITVGLLLSVVLMFLLALSRGC